MGDANGQHMFTHVANVEATVAWSNATARKKVPMDYSAVPHAIFCRPQVAAVGLTEAQAEEHYHISVGTARYWDTAKGEAMAEKDGFAKAVVDEHTGQLLGFHIVGPYAPILIQEVIDAMATGGKTDPVARGIHIHPALPELIQRTLENIE